mgnify:CR=1 FL=1
MKREDKISLVENLSKKFDENNIFYIMDASGLTVSQVNQFREKCFKKDVEYKVVKNSFIKKALENNENDYSPLINKDVLSGFSGILFSKLSPSEKTFPLRISLAAAIMSSGLMKLRVPISSSGPHLPQFLHFSAVSRRMFISRLLSLYRLGMKILGLSFLLSLISYDLSKAVN